MAGQNTVDDSATRDLNETQRQQNEEIAGLRRQISSLTNTISKTLTEEQKRQLNLQGATVQVSEFGDAIDHTNPIIRAHGRYLEDQQKKLQNLNEAIYQSSAALKDGFKNLISQSDRSFGKYNGAIEGMAGAASKVAGPIFGSFISAAGKVTTAMLSQYDAFLKTTDSLSKVGATVGMTTSEFRDLAHASGVTSKNLEILAKPLKELGVDLTLLSGNSADGAREFAKLTAVSSEQRQSYQRLGVSQEELIKNQADYIALQGAMGRNIKGELKDRALLQRETLEYTDRLVTLSTLTGQDVDSIKRKQKEAADDLTFQISMYKLNRKIQEAKAKGDTDEVARLEKQKDTQSKVLEQVAGLNNDIVTKGVRQMISTGTIAGEESAALVRMGLLEDVQRLGRVIKEGGDAQAASLKFQDEYNKKFNKTIDAVGTSVQFVNDIGKSFGITKDSVKQGNRDLEKNFQEQGKLAKDRVEAQKKEGFDFPKDARAKLTEAEIKAGKTLDWLTGSAGFAAISIAALGAASAFKTFKLENIRDSIGSLSKQLGTLGRTAATTVPAAAPQAGNVLSLLQGGAGAAGAAGAGSAGAGAAGAGAGAAGAAASTALGTLSKLATPLAAVTGVVTGLVTTASGIKEANQELKEGKITAREAKVKKAEAIGSGTGTAAGTIAGAVIGQALIPIPVLGAAIGGAVGGWLGSTGGKAIGGIVGDSVADEIKDADKEKERKITKVEATNPLPVAIIKGLEPLQTLSQNKQKTNSEISAPTKSESPVTDTKEINDKLALLERQKAKLENQGPRTSTEQSKETHREMLKTLEMAIEAEKNKNVKKEKLDRPKAQEGASFSGPKEGYLVELHGDEDVIPRKNDLVKKGPLEDLATKTSQIVSAPKQFAQNAVADATGYDMAGNIAGKAIEKVLEKSSAFVSIQKLAGNLQTAGKIESVASTDQDAAEQLKEILRVIPKTGNVLNKLEGVQKIFSSDSNPIEKLWEVAKLLHPAARTLGAVIEIAKPLLQNANKSVDTTTSPNDDMPKAAIGGVFKGPKSGYPVMLHGEEAVVPLNQGQKLSDLSTNNERGFDEEELEKFEKFGKSLEDSDKILKKLTFTLIKLEKINQKDLDLKEEFEKVNEELAEKSKKSGNTLENLIEKFKNLSPRAIGAGATAAGGGSGGAGGGSGGAGGGTGGTSKGGTSGQSGAEASQGGGFFSKIGSMLGIGGTKEPEPMGEQGKGATKAPEGSVQGLLDFIAKHESGGNYNILVGGKKANLTEMTVDQVLDLQKQMRSMGHESSAVGKYQIINKTLLGIMGSAGVRPTDKFDQSTQDKLGVALLKNRGLDAYLNKKIDAESFADNLSKEWASLPYRTGRSFYAGVGSNKSLTSRNEFINSLPKARTGGNFEGPDDGYQVELHGDETVIPTRQIKSIIKTDLNDLVLPTAPDSPNITANFADQLKNLMDPKSNVAESLKTIQNDFKVMFDKFALQLEQNTTGQSATSDTALELLSEKLDTMIDAITDGNDTRQKILQYSKT